ncbi:hypothetical protein T439DRAFT_357328 [Meredithblackwellia eburnea MCA 4105]
MTDERKNPEQEFTVDDSEVQEEAPANEPDVPDSQDDDEVSKGNDITSQELSDISEDNIVEGKRSTRGDPLKADKEVDEAVKSAEEAK